MGKLLTINLDDDSVKILEDLKKDTDFNVSQFVQSAFKNRVIKLLDPDRLTLEIKRKESELEIAKNEIEFMRDELRKIKIKIEFEEKEKETKELIELSKKDRMILGFQNSILNFFDISEDQAKEYAQNYFKDEDYKKIHTIVEYMQSKGFIMKS